MSDKTKQKLIELKVHPKESYEDVIKRLIKRDEDVMKRLIDEKVLTNGHKN